ncbi:hypothetical protein Ccrd_010550 [Cynara cardunculus var. scolymus]|uniref:Uncharacterized protein n=1 Tax=Cynara cardunculus var. scolymus TaxID=59895 RepID=A0A103YKZ2_CYNCS|nr:hypothetical protein Ccrd_010550 [Cynara cardunculus var. scolymus]
MIDDGEQSMEERCKLWEKMETRSTMSLLVAVIVGSINMSVITSASNIGWCLIFQLANSEEYIDGQFTGNLGEILISSSSGASELFNCYNRAANNAILEHDMANPIMNPQQEFLILMGAFENMYKKGLFGWSLNNKKQTYSLVIMPTHHRGSYKYEYPPTPENKGSILFGIVWQEIVKFEQKLKKETVGDKRFDIRVWNERRSSSSVRWEQLESDVVFASDRGRDGGD